MYKEILSSIDSIEIYPIISFVIFFCFFTFLLFQVWRSDKSLMTKLSVLPLDQDETKNILRGDITSQVKNTIK